MKYFVSIVECNSFTEAAEQCYISQSAISQQMQTLEKELGVKLIHRDNRKFNVTSAGEHFYRHCKGILDEVDALCRETISLGQENGLRLRVGYLRCYGGQELHQVIANFSTLYPDVPVSIVNGTHEELYDLLRFGGVDLVLNDQRRAFSDEYENYALLRCDCFIELSIRNKISNREYVTMEDIKHIPCILISSKEQQNIEKEYYQNTLGYSSNFLFAENLEEGRLMVTSNKGFMPIESIGTLSESLLTIQRLPLIKNGEIVKRNYCAFWRKENSNYYIEQFAAILRKLLRGE